MPWPKHHKAATRQRIVEAASRTFRAHGVAGVRVDDVMSSAGLTHGGFYAHFSSKDELLAAAVEYAGGQSIALLSATLDSLPADDRLGGVIDAYLSREHADSPERGCPVASAGAEIARMGGRQQRELARLIKGRLAWLRSVASAPGARRMKDEELLAVLSCMVGGIVFARALGGKDADAVLHGCRRFLHQATANPQKISTPRRFARRLARRGGR